MGLKFLTGPFGLLGLGRGTNWPKLSSRGLLPVSATLLRISAIISTISMGPSLTNSMGMLSLPGLLLFLFLRLLF